MKERVIKSIDWISIHPLRVGMVIACLVLFITWFIQLVLLGLIVPQWSDGYGLVPGQDVTRFHRVAMEQAGLIREYGWSVWELRPNGWGISGILSAWYALTCPTPWAFAPVQALIYGICGALLFSLLRHLIGRPRWALIVLLPMILPTAAFVYAQPHRDLLVFMGLVLAIYGWWLLARMLSTPLGLQWILGLLCGAGLILAGFMVAWSVRAFTAEIFLGLSILMIVILLVFFLCNIGSEPLSIYLFKITIPLIAVVLSFVMVSFHAGGGWNRYLTIAEEPTRVEDSVIEISNLQNSTKLSHKYDDVWRQSNWLPSKLDDRVRRLAGAREHFLINYSDGRSAVDVDIRFRSVEEILPYMPRALQIGLLSPFPNQWLPHEEAPAVRNVYRVVAGAEMVLIYVVLPFLLYAIYAWRKRPELWIMLLPALAWVLIYTYTVPVVGSLMRYRFGGYIIIIMLAMAGLLQAIHDYRNWRRRDSF